MCTSWRPSAARRGDEPLASKRWTGGVPRPPARRCRSTARRPLRPRIRRRARPQPFDRALLSRVAPRFAPGRPVLEVGAGPGHVAAHLAASGVTMVVSDASLGQLREALVLDPSRPVLAADLARLPAGGGRLGGVVAFYCLIYGPAAWLDDVFADWHDALAPGAPVIIAVHAGAGELHVDDWQGRAVDLTVVLRDPDDLVARLEAAGFAVDECTVAPVRGRASDRPLLPRGEPRPWVAASLNPVAPGRSGLAPASGRPAAAETASPRRRPRPTRPGSSSSARGSRARPPGPATQTSRGRRGPPPHRRVPGPASPPGRAARPRRRTGACPPGACVPPPRSPAEPP